MKSLIEGYKRFRAVEFPLRQSAFHLLAEGQSPEYLFITCADSRVVPDLILGTGPGDLFICRNAGNVVPRGDEPGGGVAATIEYAVDVLGVRHVIVCGHSDCGALKAALNPEKLQNLPEARAWLKHVEAAHDFRLASDGSGDEATELRAIIRGNVVAQLENLKTEASVAHGLAAGTLTAHGWYYDILTGQIDQYIEETKEFLPLV